MKTKITVKNFKLPYPNPKNKQEISANGYAKLCVIRTAINPPGYEPDYSNPDEPKWKCIWEYKAGSGFVFDGSDSYYAHAHSGGGPLLDCETRELANHLATFKTEWREFLEGR